MRIDLQGITVAVALALPQAASAFPSSWHFLRDVDDAVLVDVADDHDEINPVEFDGSDVFGSNAAPAGAWSADQDFFYVRMRLAADPKAGGATLVPGAVWAVLIDTEASASGDEAWEFQVLVSGPTGAINVYRNGNGTAGAAVPLAGQTLVLTSGGDTSWGALGAEVRVVAATAPTSWYLDIALDRDELFSELSIEDDTPLRVALASGAGFTGPRVDLAGCDRTLGACTTLADVLSRPLYLDLDGDGLSDALELDLGTDPRDADSDDDGVADGDEPQGLGDDGVLPALDCDSDGDGLLDGTEAGLTAPLADTDPEANCWLGDADHATTTNPSLRDTDAGGLHDGLEDWNHDGLFDATCFETDPNDPADDVDTDQDGVADVLELRGADASVDDVDSDGDGISDKIEGLNDPDGDCVPAFLDDDSDGDGFLDVDEGGGDLDDDGIPNALDDDSDGDGRPDELETGDIDCDGIPDWEDTDDFDGLCDEPQVDPEPLDEDPRATLDFQDGYFSGGACSSAPAGTLFGPLGWLAALLVLRRRRATALAALLPGAALAQDVNAQRFEPAVDGVRFLQVEDVSPSVRARWGLGLLANYAKDPLVWNGPDGQTSMLGSVLTADLLGYYNLGPVRLGLDLPVHLYTAGYEIEQPIHLGDARLSSKLYTDQWLHLPVDLGAWLDLTLPTGASKSYVGDARVGLSLGLAATWELKRLAVAGNVGMQTGNATSVGALDLTPAMIWKLGVAYELIDDLWLSAELDAETWFKTDGEHGASPAEAIGSVRMRTASDLFVTLGGGAGLNDGLGAPDFRVMAGLSWVPLPRPEQEETVDSEPAPVLGDMVVRVMGPSGVPVSGAEVRVVGAFGAPMKVGSDGLFEARLRPGTYSVSVGAEGWQPQERTLEIEADAGAEAIFVLWPIDEVVIDREARQIYLNRKVFFELESDDLAPESLRTLDTLVATLLAHPEITLVRIEGHTDYTGSHAFNQRLSEERAQAVRAYLQVSGIEGARLQAVGKGESRPLQEGESESVHATNRRVEFHIEVQE